MFDCDNKGEKNTFSIEIIVNIRDNICVCFVVAVIGE